MTQGRKYDPSPLSSAAASTDNWLSPNPARGPEKTLLDDPRWFEDEHEVTSASNFDHLLVFGLMATVLLGVLRLTGLI
ncbi:MAG: hypothetical protein KTR30_04650 [Saprospiraceae bacterium]|nr:hypothetical protein [Saprospiraceae bacterium]